MNNLKSTASAMYIEAANQTEEFLKSLSSDDRLNCDDLRDEIAAYREAASSGSWPLLYRWFAGKNTPVVFAGSAGVYWYEVMADVAAGVCSVLIRIGSYYYEVNSDGMATGKHIRLAN